MPLSSALALGDQRHRRADQRGDAERAQRAFAGAGEAGRRRPPCAARSAGRTAGGDRGRGSRRRGRPRRWRRRRRRGTARSTAGGVQHAAGGRLDRGRAQPRRIVDDHAAPRTRHSSASVPRQSGVCISTRRLTTASNAPIGERQVRGRRRAAGRLATAARGDARLADAQHLARGVDAGDARRRGPAMAAPRGRCRCRRRGRRRRTRRRRTPRARAPPARGDQLADRAAEAQRVEPLGDVGIGVVLVAVMGSASRDAPRHLRPRRSRRARRRPGACARGRPRSCTSCRPARGPGGRCASASAGSSTARRMPAANASGVASVRTAIASSSTWVCVSSRVATIGRPERRYW